MKSAKLAGVMCVVLGMSEIAFAAAAAGGDKSRYDLANPTPRAQMRELATDRPDKTECPFTVDAGHLQIEWDWAVLTHEKDTADGADTRTTSWSLLPVNFRLGLTNAFEVGLMLAPHERQRMEDRSMRPPAVERLSGFGDVTLRCKFNFWGNDGGDSALGLMPFIKFPTGRTGLGNSAVEGGVLLPFSHALPLGWSCGAQTEIDLMKNATGGGRHLEFINTITFSRTIVGELGGYVEVYSQHSAERGARWIGTLDFGFTYGLSKDTQLDAGINLGLCRAAPNTEIFTGFTVRF
ncbi:MAG: transporter [Opitutae bacterium]|nr:transporter [Opitutae bacterium]